MSMWLGISTYDNCTSLSKKNFAIKCVISSIIENKSRVFKNNSIKLWSRHIHQNVLTFRDVDWITCSWRTFSAPGCGFRPTINIRVNKTRCWGITTVSKINYKSTWRKCWSGTSGTDNVCVVYGINWTVNIINSNLCICFSIKEVRTSYSNLLISCGCSHIWRNR